MQIDLSGRHALVCGSTQGIGLASARALVEAGARVTLLARDEAALDKLVQELKLLSPNEHNYAVADFSDRAAVKRVVADVTQVVRVHVLVNNTGGPPGGTAVEADADEYERAFRMHLIANQHLVQGVVPGMREAGFGRIINIISTSVKQPIPGLGVSNTIRGAVASWSKTLAGELGPDGITVNNVLPGFTDTQRLANLIAGKAEKSGKSESEVAGEMRAKVPAGRLGLAEELAAAVVFLASSQAAYINGINLPVDGGRTLSL